VQIDSIECECECDCEDPCEGFDMSLCDSYREIQNLRDRMLYGWRDLTIPELIQLNNQLYGMMYQIIHRIGGDIEYRLQQIQIARGESGQIINAPSSPEGIYMAYIWHSIWLESIMWVDMNLECCRKK